VCECASGFLLDGDVCEECFQSTDCPNGGQNYECNTNVCECASGYILNGNVCEECFQSTDCPNGGQNYECNTNVCECVSGFLLDGDVCVAAQDCYDIHQNNLPSGTYNLNSIIGSVKCLEDGWTSIQHRGQHGNPKDYFSKNWSEYVQGFGSPG